MKKSKFLAFLIAAICFLGGCGSKAQLPDDPIIYEQGINKEEGYSSNEWIIETLGLNNCNEGMILREMNTTNIPDGLESEYEW